MGNEEMGSDQVLLAIVGALTWVMALVSSRTDFAEDLHRELRGWRAWFFGNWSARPPETNALNIAVGGLGLFLWCGSLGYLPEFKELNDRYANALIGAAAAVGFLQWLTYVEKVAPGRHKLLPLLRVGQGCAVAYAVIWIGWPAAGAA